MKTIKIKDYYGKYCKVSVSDEFYEEWLLLQKETQRVYRSEVRHRSPVSLDDIDLYLYHTYGSPVEELLIAKEEDVELLHAIEQLSPIQRKRVKQLMADWSLHDISKDSACSYNAAKFSLKLALKKLHEFLNE